MSNHISFSIFRLSLVLSAAVLLLGAGSARAISFDFTSDHCTGGCGTPPFGTVTLNQNGANVDIVVHLFSPNFFVKTGAGNFQAFKFNGIDVVLGDITVDAHVPALTAATGAFNSGGTGDFEFGITCPTCQNGAPDSFNTDIEFTVANATIADLTVPNNFGNLFAADIFSSNLDGLGGTGNTGMVDVVPEPGTAALFGLGIVGLAVAGRRRAWRARRQFRAVLEDLELERRKVARGAVRTTDRSAAAPC